MNVDIRTLDSIRVAAIEHEGCYTGIAPCFERIFGWAGPKGLIGPSTQCYGVFHHDPKTTPAEELRSAACLSVGPEFAGDPEAGIVVTEIPAGDYAVTMFKGPYGDLESAYTALAEEWLPQSGRQPDARPCVEVYHNSPQDTAPEELLTEIHFPIQ